MKAKLLLLATWLISHPIFAQEFGYYFAEAKKNFEQEKWELAEQNYSNALMVNNTADVFYNRGLVRMKQKRMDCGCADLNSAQIRGHQQAKQAFWKFCARKDTLFRNQNQLSGEDSLYDHIVMIYYKYNDLVEVRKFDADDSLRVAIKMVKNDTISISGEEVEFYFETEKHQEFNDYVESLVNYPSKAKNGNLEGTAIVKVIVDDLGAIAKVEIMDDINPFLSEEAFRVAYNLRASDSPTFKGKHVHTEMTIPIAFNLNKSKRGFFK